VSRALVIASALALVVGAASAAVGDYLVAATGSPDAQRLGPYRYGVTPGYAAAARAFGAPSARSVSGSSCAVRWAGLGLSVTFATFGAGSPCDPGALAAARWAGASIRSAKWTTTAGLRVGDTLATLRRLYPHAVHVARSRWLLTYKRGEVGLIPYLEADVHGGVVVALVLPLPRANVR
jgi:hypothetical protein